MEFDFATYLRTTLPSGETDESYVVYWIHDEFCHYPQWDGYVGVTKEKRLSTRLKEHRKSKRFKGVPFPQTKILAKGFASTCFIYERVLRPQPNMGWNKTVGGARGFMVNRAHSQETKNKIGNANRGNKRPDLSERNKTMNHEVRLTKLNNITCPHCGKIGSGVTMLRYHFGRCKFK